MKPPAGALLVVFFPYALSGSLILGLGVGAITEPGVGVAVCAVVLVLALWRIARCSWRADDRTLTVTGSVRTRTVQLRHGALITVVTPWWLNRGMYILVVLNGEDSVRIPSTLHFSRRAREAELQQLRHETKLRTDSVAGYTL